MYKTPSKRRSSGKPPFTPKKRGLFEDGIWLCDCKPRKPALSLKVKKQGPNKGKTFYTCDERKCDFFLFEHDAAAREREALMTHNCRSENGIVARVQAKGEPPVTPSFGRTGRAAAAAAPPPKIAPPQQRIFTGMAPSAGTGSRLSQDSEYLSYDSDEGDAQHGAGPNSTDARNGSAAGNSSGSKSSGGTLFGDSRGAAPPGLFNNSQRGAPVTPSAKRKRGVFLADSDEEFGGDELDDLEVDRQLARAVEDSARKRQKQQHETSFTTPSAHRGGGAGNLPTPLSRNSLLISAEDRDRSARRLRFAGEAPIAGDDEDELGQGGQHAGLVRDATTPTPYRKTNALLPATSEPATPSAATRTAPSPFKTPADAPQIAEDVMGLLSGQPVSEALRRSVRTVLERHEMRVKGVVKGRDAARAALGSRDARIAELQARVVSLENARRMDRESLRELSRGLDRLSQGDDV